MKKIEIIKDLLPPILFKGLSFLKNTFDAYRGNKLFGGDDQLFKEVLSKAKIYAEYGSGASTIWVAKNTNCQIYSVDSSQAWLDIVEKKAAESSRLHLHYSNIGKTVRWGVPINYEMAENFFDYTDWVWSKATPDVVLIDGRFRVCCFLVSILNANPGTTIIFDDYVEREYYHFVEKFVKPKAYCGRQALFIVPDEKNLDKKLIQNRIENFRYVFD